MIVVIRALAVESVRTRTSPYYIGKVLSFLGTLAACSCNLKIDLDLHSSMPVLERQKCPRGLP